MSALTSVPLGHLRFDQFESILPPDRYAQVLEAVDRGRRLLEGRIVWNVNSTARGGGVVELLGPLVA